MILIIACCRPYCSSISISLNHGRLSLFWEAWRGLVSRWIIFQLLPFGFLQVTQILVGHVGLPPLIHLLRCEPLDPIQDRWSPKNIHKWLSNWGKNRSYCTKISERTLEPLMNWPPKSRKNNCGLLYYFFAVFSLVASPGEVSISLPGLSYILKCFTKETGLIH